MLMALLSWIVVGAVGGWLAGYALHRDTGFDLMDVVTGMIGAVVGGWLVGLATGVDPAGISALNIIAAFVGALLVAFIWSKVRGA